MWHSLKELIPKAAGKYQLQPALKALEVFKMYRQVAPTLLPSLWTEQTFTQSYKDAVFTLGVKNSMWAQELTMKKHLIQDYINKECGENTVTKIKVILIEENVEKPFEAC